MPRYSTVCMRNLRPNPYEVWRSEGPVAEKIEAGYRPGGTFWSLKAFHATKLEWVYALTPEFVQEARKIVGSVGGAISGQTQDETAAVRGLDGAPAKSHGANYYGCANNPRFWDFQWRQIKRALDAGADTNQQDEPEYGFYVQHCYCDHCVREFRAWLKGLAPAELKSLGVGDVEAFNYRDLVQGKGASKELAAQWQAFKTRRLHDFHLRMRDEQRRYKPDFGPYTCNNSSFQKYGPLYETFDVMMSELMFVTCDPARLFARHEVVMEAGKAQIYHAPKANNGEPMEYMKPLTRAVIAQGYGMGAWVAAPYDLYITMETPRYFGKPEDYADLYGFVRANASYLDGFERAAYCGAWLADRKAGRVLEIEGGSGGTYAFARTRPGDANAPIVIHLIDWGAEKEYLQGGTAGEYYNTASYIRGDKAPFTLKVRMANCYGARPFRARLLTPAPYDAAAHEKAQKTGDFSALSQSREIAFEAKEQYALFSIPRLDPYGLLVLEPR